MMLSIGETMIGESKASVPVYFIDRSYEGYERIISYTGENKLSLEGMNKYDIQIMYDNMFYFHMDKTRKVILEYTSNNDIHVSRDYRVVISRL